MEDDDRLFMLLSDKVSQIATLAGAGQNRAATGDRRAELSRQIRDLAEEVDILGAIAERLMAGGEPRSEKPPVDR